MRRTERGRKSEREKRKKENLEKARSDSVSHNPSTQDAEAGGSKL